MKSGTAHKVRDVRPPAAAQQRRNNAEKRLQDRHKPATMSAAEHGEPGSDRRPPQQSSLGLPERAQISAYSTRYNKKIKMFIILQDSRC